MKKRSSTHHPYVHEWETLETDDECVNLFHDIFLIEFVCFSIFHFCHFHCHRPDLTVKKRRGGQRMRRLKGRYEETTLMKQANTRAFSMQTGEYGDDAMGRTLGLLEMSTGSVGASATTEHSTIRSKNSIEQKKMKYANTRASRKKATQMSRQGLAIASSSFDNHNTNQSSGMASSMVFTPVQGMELVNPDAMKDRVKEANRKWFSSNAGFQSAVPPKK